MATAAITNTFVDATPAEAADVNTNFTDLVTFANGSTVHVDGSKAMSGAFDAGTNKIVNVTTGTADNDAVNTAQLSAIHPVGGIIMWGGLYNGSPPSGWALCNGQALNRTTYSALYAVVGVTYGDGNGSTTFEVPNLEGAFPVGQNATYPRRDGGSTRLGSKDAVAVNHGHGLSGAVENDTAPHTHSFSDTANTGYESAHTHTDGIGSDFIMAGTGGDGATHTLEFGSYVSYSRQSVTGGQPGSGHRHSVAVSGTTGAASATDATHGHTDTFAVTNLTGEAGTDANMPPYVAVTYLIRTGV